MISISNPIGIWMPLTVRNNNQCNGFILVMVLLILQILTLLSWFAVQSAFLNEKNLHQLFSQQLLINAGEEVLARVEQKPMAELTHCLSAIQSGCFGELNTYHYSYWLDVLAVDPCANIMALHAYAHYYRIVLIIQSKQAHQQVYLQSTIIQPVDGSDVCQGVSHAVTLGRQSLVRLTIPYRAIP